MTKHGEPLAYYLDHVEDDTDDCIIWPYAITAGYGTVRLNGRRQYVHVLACEQHYGPKPVPGMWVAHAPVICHNPLCFNWRHLRWATLQENLADRFIDQTTPAGEANGRAKLTSTQVAAIRADYATSGISQRALACKFGVGKTAINNIVHNRRWASPARPKSGGTQ